VALSSNKCGVVSVLEDAIILCGNCPSSVEAKVELTDTKDEIRSRNKKSDTAPKCPKFRKVSSLTRSAY
jgi:hypothetical protein